MKVPKKASIARLFLCKNDSEKQKILLITTKSTF